MPIRCLPSGISVWNVANRIKMLWQNAVVIPVHYGAIALVEIRFAVVKENKMAQISKIKRTGIPMYFNHCNRKENDGIDRSNECIDNERTHLNYHFKEGSMGSYKERLNSLYYPEKKEDVVTLASCVITLPKNVREGDEKKFFESCYDFLCNDFGYENIVNAVVHMDETTPHIHVGFIPAIAREDIERSAKYEKKIEDWESRHQVNAEGIVSAKDVLNLQYFKTLHPRLYEHIEKDLGYEVEILNGATAGGNKTILELKNQKIEEQLKQKQEEVEKLSGNIQIITRQLDSLGIDKRYMDMSELLAKMSMMQEENKAFRELLVKNDIAIPKETALALREMRSSYHFGNVSTLTGAFQPKKEFIVVETFKEIERSLPLDNFIAEHPTLLGAVHFRKPKAVLEEHDSENKYLIVPTDTIMDTIEAMYYIKQNEEKYSSLSLRQFSNDPDNLVREILQNTKIDTEYFLALMAEEAKVKEQIRNTPILN